jgi:hypothetical protein
MRGGRFATVFYMSFFRHGEIFRSDVMRSVRQRRNRRSPAHRLDEFPVDYSSASCTPAALASASPTGIHSATQTGCRHRSFQPTPNSVLTFCVTPGDNRKPESRIIGYSVEVASKWERVLNRVARPSSALPCRIAAAFRLLSAGYGFLSRCGINDCFTGNLAFAMLGNCLTEIEWLKHSDQIGTSR